MRPSSCSLDSSQLAHSRLTVHHGHPDCVSSRAANHALDVHEHDVERRPVGRSSRLVSGLERFERFETVERCRRREALERELSREDLGVDDLRRQPIQDSLRTVILDDQDPADVIAGLELRRRLGLDWRRVLPDEGLGVRRSCDRSRDDGLS